MEEVLSILDKYYVYTEESLKQKANTSIDPIVNDAIGKDILEHIPHAKLIEVENCGHWTVVEKPDEMNRIAFDFFE